MSVTFSSQAPVMAKTQFGHQQQAKTNVTQFSSNHNPANSSGAQAASRTQFGAICTTLCCVGAAPIALIGGLLTGIFFLIKGLAKKVF